MTRYAKFELRVKLASNEEFQPCDLLKFETTMNKDSDTDDVFEVLQDMSWDALGHSAVNIGEEAFDPASPIAIALVDNTRSDYPVEFTFWDSEGVRATNHMILAGHWALIPGTIGEDQTYIKCASAGMTANVRLVIFGEAA